MTIKSIKDIDLSTANLPEGFGVIDRSWKQELIYFLMVDRFHDWQERPIGNYTALEDRNFDAANLKHRIGGSFNGIRSQLSYIKNLGCTCIWLSPVFDNYEESYHGYAIRNFLDTDALFGTKEELKTLVKEAHLLGLRVVLDIVINHTASTWEYAEKDPVYNGSTFSFGNWKDDEYPLPRELRTPSYYKKAGLITNWDAYPETQEGDIFELKKLILDTSPIGKEVLDIFIKIYSYWIKELDLDGYRLDTVKHLLPSTVAIFCNEIKEYAKYLGKDNFMIFGEAIGDDKLLKKYLKPQKIEAAYYKGIDALLDFPLHFVLEEVVKGKREVKELYKIFYSKQKMLIQLNKKWTDLIVFADNHDQIGQEYKARIAYNSDEKEVLAIIGFLYFLYGIPCLFYGTEQLLNGNGTHDSLLREPLFDKTRNLSFHNEELNLYKEIAVLASLRKELVLFQEANLEIDMISVNASEFLRSDLTNRIVYWSKRIFNDKLLIAYNPQKAEIASICLKLSLNGERIKNNYKYVYGGVGEVLLEEINGCGYLNIDLNPQQFVILK